MNAPPDREAALQRVGGDKEALAELVSVFLRNCPAMVQQIRTAAANASPAELAATAHKLKSAAGFVAACGLAEIAEELETLSRGGDLARVDLVVDRLVAAAADAERVLARWLR